MAFDAQEWLRDKDTFRFMVSKGFRVMDDLDEQERLKLLKEIFNNNNVELLKDLIENGLVVKNFPLIFATEALQQDDVRIIRCLMEHGCPVRPPLYGKKRKPAKNPLIGAIQNNLPKVVEFLLQKGARFGELELKEVGKTQNPEFLELLRRCDIDLNVEGPTILKGALEPTKRVDRIEGNNSRQINMIKTLLSLGVDIVERDGSTCGHTFVGKCTYFSPEEKEDMIDTLLQFGLDINQKDGFGATLLHSTNMLDMTMMEILLKKCVDPNIKTNSGYTAAVVQMMHLISRGRLKHFSDCVDLFVRYQADLNSKDSYGNSILDMLYCRTRCMSFGIRIAVNKILSIPDIEIPTRYNTRPGSFVGYSPCTFPLVQAGCRFPQMFFGLSTCMTETFGDLIPCADPYYCYNYRGTRGTKYPSLDYYQINGSAWEENNNHSALYTTTYMLKYLAVYTIRKQILEANGYKTIIPRARKLPLPQSLRDMVTLERFKVKDMYSEMNEDYKED